MEVDKVIVKVKALLALSTSSNVNEAAVAAGLANKLMDEYRLSLVDLEGTTEEVVEPYESDEDYVYQSGKITPWKVALIKTLAKHYGCANFNDCVYTTGRKVSRFKLIGRKSDLTICKYMISWLTLECIRLSTMFAGSGRVFIASYCAGFVAGVAEQLKLSRAEVQKDASSSAIVKLDARSEEARVAMYQLHSNLKATTSVSYSQKDAVGFAAGKEQGQKIHLGSALSVGSKTKMLNG